MSIAWFFVLDLGLKAVAAVILWRLFHAPGTGRPARPLMGDGRPRCSELRQMKQVLR